MEDDARAARTLAQLLREDGYDVDVVLDGAAAITRLGTGKPPQVLIADFLLPHADGLAVARHARRVDPTIAIIFVTSYVEVLQQSDRKLDPPPVIMGKPLVYQDLTSELNRLLK